MMRKNWMMIVACFAIVQVAKSEALFAQTGTDPTFRQLLESGKLSKGHITKAGVTGSKIDVKSSLEICWWRDGFFMGLAETLQLENLS